MNPNNLTTTVENNNPAVLTPSPASANLPHIDPVTAGKVSLTVILSMMTLFVSLVGTFVIYFTNVSTKSRIKQTETSIQQLTKIIESPPLSLANQKLTAVNRALAGYSAAAATKINFQDFFERLPTRTPKDMRISSLTIDSEGKVRIAGSGTVFDTAGKSILAFASSAGLTDIALSNIGLSGGEGQRLVTFELTAKLDRSQLLLNQPVTAPDNQTN